ncbi:MAG TPA: hypothetical protein VK627_07790 [Edaphobacter sp.]|jgi:hypothetical protein|nr:hypothetical protein [Edaphobacter sp.]
MWQQVQLALSQSAHRVLVKLASFLPGLLAFLVAVIVLTAIGAGVAALLRRILLALKFDERLARNSIVSEWTPSHSPTVLLTRAAFWACFILGVIVGISAVDASYSNTSQMSVFLLPYLTHSVGAVILLIAGNLIARFLARSVLIGAVNAKLQYARFLSLGIKWLVLVLTAAMVLDHLEIGGTIIELAFGILFGGIVLTLSLAVGIGSRDIVSRSLEKNVERPNLDPLPGDPDYRATPTETLRHF